MQRVVGMGARGAQFHHRTTTDAKLHRQQLPVQAMAQRKVKNRPRRIPRQPHRGPQRFTTQHRATQHHARQIRHQPV